MNDKIFNQRTNIPKNQFSYITKISPDKNLKYIQLSCLLMISPQLSNTFLQTFSHLPPSFLLKYSEQIQNYHKIVIPFQQSLFAESQTLNLKTTSLERQKRQLQHKISSLTAQNQRQQSLMQSQSYRINDLQNTIVELQKAVNDNLSIVQVLKISAGQMEIELGQAVQKVKKAEQEKKQILLNFELKKNEYNTLLEGYMKDKNVIAEKLNYMNQLQQSLMQKQKHMKQDQLYLKKQWQQFESRKKQKQRPKIFKTESAPLSSPPSTSKSQPQSKPDQIYRTPIKKLIKHHNGQIYDIVSNVQMNMFASCGADRLVKIFNCKNLEVSNIIKPEQDNVFLTVRIFQDGKKIIVGGSDRSVQIYEVQSGLQYRKYLEHNMKVNSVILYEKDKFVSASEDKQIKIWSIQNQASQCSIATGRPVKCLSSRPKQSSFYSGHSDGSVRIYTPSQPSAVSQIKGIIDRPINSIFPLSSPTQVLVSSQQGSPIHILDFKMNKSIGKFEGQDYCNSTGKSITSPLQKYVIAGNCDGNLYYWNKQSMKFDRKVGGHDYGISGLAEIKGGVVSGDAQGNVIVWNV